MEKSLELFYQCMAMLGVAIDEELYEQSLKALSSGILWQQAVRIIDAIGKTDDGLTHAILIRIFAQSVWQAGYRAAPTLEFVLQEGVGG